MRHRVVITGMGAITPLGTGLEKFWQGLISGQSGIARITHFEPEPFSSQIAGEVNDFEPGQFLDRKEIKRMDRFVHFAIAGAKMALADSGLEMETIDRSRVGVIIGCGVGGMATFEDQARVLIEKGPQRVSPFFVPMMIGNMASSQISIALGAQGPNFTVMTACASATNAIGEAFKLLQYGVTDVVITGGTEAAITPLSVAGFCAMKALSTRNEDPQKASRPFEANRDGFVIGEGSGILILETMDHAIKRGAKIYAEVIGYGASADAYHITAPAPGGQGAALAMRLALQDAGLKPGEIDYINAHGTSTELNDRFETLAIKDVFGDHAAKLAVSSTKSMTGHLLGAAGAIEAIATAMAINQDIIPPTINYEQPDPELDLDYVPNKARETKVNAALSNSLGFGGHNATIIMKKYL